MSFYKEQEIKTPRIHINIRLYNKTQKQQYLNKRVFRISGAVKNNIPGVEHICPNSKMLWFKLINTFFFNKGGFGICGAVRNTNPGEKVVQNQHF